MKTVKLALVAAIATTALAAGAAQAYPHRGMRHCHMERHHHHMVRVCDMRHR